MVHSSAERDEEEEEGIASGSQPFLGQYPLVGTRHNIGSKQASQPAVLSLKAFRGRGNQVVSSAALSYAASRRYRPVALAGRFGWNSRETSEKKKYNDLGEEGAMGASENARAWCKQTQAKQETSKRDIFSFFDWERLTTRMPAYGVFPSED